MNVALSSSARIDHQSPSKLDILKDILVVVLSFVLIRVFTRSMQWGIPLVLITASANILRIALIWWLLRRQDITWAELGFRRPERLVPTLLMGVGTGVAALILSILVQTITAVMFPNLPLQDLSIFTGLSGNAPLLIFSLVIVWTVIAPGEELIWRAFMIDRFSALFGETRAFKIVGLLGSMLVFAAIHMYLGPAGMISASVTGLVFGTAYLVTKQNVWVAAIAHGLVNTVSFIALFAV